MKLKLFLFLGFLHFFSEVYGTAVVADSLCLEEETNTEFCFRREFKDECRNICDSCENLDELYNSWGLRIGKFLFDACEFVITYSHKFSYSEFELCFEIWRKCFLRDSSFEEDYRMIPSYSY